MKILLKLISLFLFFGLAACLGYGWQRVSVDQASSHLVKRVEPQYPQLARAAHIQGEVVIAVTITETGAVSNPKYVSGHPMLMQAALDAVREWQYSPFLTDGKRVQKSAFSALPSLLDGYGTAVPLLQQPENRDARLSSHKHLAICDYRSDEFILWAKMVT